MGWLQQTFVNAVRFICLEYSASPVSVSVVLGYYSNKYELYNSMY